MKEILSGNDRSSLNKLIAESEKHTKAQIVLAVIKRSDSYAELPWKAFAVGASLMGLIVFLMDLTVLQWISDTIVLISVGTTLAAGFFMFLLTILFPGFARLFLTSSRRETETQQYAGSLFLERELFATKGRKGILLFVSQFERQVVILPDKGLRSQLGSGVLKNIIEKMSQSLRRNEVKQALETGLKEITVVLESSGSTGSGGDELSNEIIEEEGA